MESAESLGHQLHGDVELRDELLQLNASVWRNGDLYTFRINDGSGGGIPVWNAIDGRNIEKQEITAASCVELDGNRECM